MIFFLIYLFFPISVPKEAEAAPEENQEKPADEQNVEVKEEHNEASNAEDESDMWEETYKTHTDSKPNGLILFIIISLNSK